MPDPYAHYEDLRRQGPVIWNPRFGYWMAVSHRAAKTALRDVTHFSSALQGPAEASLYGAPTMIFSDPPEHNRLRRAVSKGFAEAVARLEPRLPSLAEQIVAAALAKAEFDAVADIAGPLPVMVISEVLGLPEADLPILKQASDQVVSLSTRGGGARTRKAAAAQLRSYFLDRLHRPGGAEDGGLLPMFRRLLGEGAAEAELVGSCMLLLVAGHETTTRFLSNCMLALARNPDAFGSVRSGDVPASVAVDELLRFDGAVHVLRRITTSPVDLGGVHLQPGDSVAVLVAAANRDPQVFTRPNEIDFTREDRRHHLAFGVGAHYCLGAPLGRIEAEALLMSLLDRLGDRRLTVTTDQWHYAPSMFVRGPAFLPMKAEARVSGSA